MSRKISDNKSNLVFLVLSVVFVLAIVFAGANFPTGFHTYIPNSVFLNPQEPYTTDNLICSHAFTDYLYTDIFWFRNDVEQEGLFNLTTVPSSSTTKNQIWKCQVVAHYDETSETGDRSRTIKNSPPSIPKVFKEGSEINEYYNIIEDQSLSFKFNSTDADNDLLSYSFVYPVDFCQVTNHNTGAFTCLVSHEHVSVSGSSDHGPEEAKNVTISLQSTENTGDVEKLASIRDFVFTLIPFNDQAKFSSTFSSVSIDAEVPWSVSIQGYDEELDYPLNFSVSSNSYLGLHFIDETDNSAVLTFPDGKPTNAQVGNYVINVSVTDSFGSDENRSPSWFTFELEIIRTNLIPYFITDFSNIQGVQGEPFLFEFEARDDDVGETITFNALPVFNQDDDCSPDYFVWDESLTTVNNTHNGGLGRFSVNNLTNDHVVCRYVNLTVTDNEGSSNSTLVFFNIANINDPPVIHRHSVSDLNIGGQSDIENISVSLYSANAFYQVNATDPDQLTYDALNTGVLAYATNDSRVRINQSGVVDLTFYSPNMIGSWNVLITVTDNGVPAISDSKVMTINVLSNSPPNISVPDDDPVFMQNDVIELFFNTTDVDGDEVSIIFEPLIDRFDSSVYSSSLVIHDSYVVGFSNVTIWKLELTGLNNRLANDLVGYHEVLIRAYDSHGAHNESFSSGVINFTILNENDAPFFDMYPRNNVSDTVHFGSMAEGRFFSVDILVTDYDLFLPSDIYEESLSFVVENYSSNLTSVSFVKNSPYSAELSFIPLNAGTHNITLRVYDLEGAFVMQTVEFFAYGITDAPEFISVKPYFNGTHTINAFESTASLSSPLYVEGVENSNVVFDADVSYTETIEATQGVVVDNILSAKWYVNGVLKSSLSNIQPLFNSSFTFYFDYFSDGVNFVTMEVFDSVGSSNNWTWSVNVSNVNRLPVYCPNTLENLSVSGSEIIRDYFGFSNQKQRFYDPDDDSLNPGPGSVNPCVSGFRGVPGLDSLEFSYQLVSNICPADFSFSGTHLTIRPTNVGECRLRFIATDEFGEDVVSDIVLLEILDFVKGEDEETERIVTVTETITVPFEERVDVPIPIKIIYPGSAVIYANQSIEVPFVIRNTWESDLSGISLSSVLLNSSLSDEDNVSVALSIYEIDSLGIDQEVSASLILSNYRTHGPFLINIIADVSSPSFTDSEALLIAGLEMAGDSPQSVRALVTYARDLLTASPECAELNDLLIVAQRALDEGRVDEALRLIDGAINGCSYLISAGEARRIEQPGMLKAGLDFTSGYWFELVISAGVLLLLAVVFYVFAVVRNSIKDKD